MHDCKYARSVWNTKLPTGTTQAFYNTNLEDWILLNVCGDVHEDIDWCNFWAIVCQSSWSWRNKEKRVQNLVRPWKMENVIMEKIKAYKEA